MEKILLARIEMPFRTKEGAVYQYAELYFNEEAGNNNQPIYKSKDSPIQIAIWSKDESNSQNS